MRGLFSFEERPPVMATTAVTSGSPVTVSTTYSELIVVDMLDFQSLMVDFENSGGVAFTGFRVSARAHASAVWHVFFDEAGHYENPQYPMEHCTEEIFTLPAGESGLLGLAGLTVQAYRFEAKVGSSTTSVNVRGWKKS